MSIERQDSEVERDIGYARVWFEDGEDAEQAGNHEKGLVAESQG